MENNTNSTEQILVPLKIKRSFRISSLIVHFFLIIFASLFIIPLVLPFLFVFKINLEFSYNPWGLPKALRLDNFIEAWKGIQLPTGMANSLIVCAGAIGVTVPAAAMAGYIFSKYRTRATDILFYVVMVGFFIPIQMVLIPLVKISNSLKLYDTLPGLFLPMAAFGVPFWTMIYRSFYNGLPNELMEASRMDGAGHFRIFIQIMFPLAKPATFLAVLLVFFGAWSDYLLSLILLSKQEHFTIQLLVTQLLGQYGANFFPEYSAGLLIAAAPTVILYIILHKKIIEGVTLSGAIKG
jgi:ABC-type glycerol-3-phosphate transport system permease component